MAWVGGVLQVRRLAELGHQVGVKTGPWELKTGGRITLASIMMENS